MSIVQDFDGRNDILLSVVDVAKLLRVSKNRVYEFINCGILPAINIGGLKVRKSTLLNFLEKYEGYDLTDLKNIHRIELKHAC